ncbi:MAG: DNA mismatch repair endonuclease MutL, partial [Halorubrum sp.]
MEPPNIERLDERTVQRIAAGEVVERPASVVKELIENSLDAGASRVAVAVESGGTEGIRVRDDGVGIPADQLEAAVAEHATSKIADIADLDRGVGTLGFRGEALYTVGAVSRLTVRSRPPGAGAGAEIAVEGGDAGDVRPAGCPEGTTVEVDDLFYNTPARKKFLKRTATEFDHVNTVVTGYALANPDVAVSLEHDGRETFATEGNGDLRSAVLAVYGREVAEAMIDVDWTPDVDADPAVRRVTGLVSHPETTRSTRDYLSTYVNDRYVTASALRQATLDAYGGQLAPDRYPFAVLFVEVPPGDVDVNVHPRKLEVRFDEEPAVRAAVEDAVGSSLLDHGLVRSTAPRGESAPDETAVRPETPRSEAVGGAGTDHERAALGKRDEGDEADDRASEPTAGVRELDPADEDAWAIDGVGGPGGDAAHSDGDDPRVNDRPSPRSWQSSPAEPDAEADGPSDEQVGVDRAGGGDAGVETSGGDLDGSHRRDRTFTPPESPSPPTESPSPPTESPS